MLWIAPSERDMATETLDKRVWAAADRFHAISGRKLQDYSVPVLGLEGERQCCDNINSYCDDLHDTTCRYDCVLAI